MKTAVVCGGTGFIGHHLARRLKSEGYWVRVVDIQEHRWGEKDYADEYVLADLTDEKVASNIVIDPFKSGKENEIGVDEVYQLAADMGGAGYIFTGDNDSAVMHNSALCNLNVLHQSALKRVGKIFYSSSACIYPERNQVDPNNPLCSEESAYPAAPDSEYGWEKLFSERLYLTYQRNHGIDVKIARFHNIFGPEGTWTGGREKSPAAFCRKVLENDKEMEMWGDGTQTRSYLFIDECITGIRTLVQNEAFSGPVNIGSEEMVSMNDFVDMIMDIENKKLTVKHITGPLGVKGRNSDNKLIKEKLNWEPSMTLKEGITKTYFWIKDQIKK